MAYLNKVFLMGNLTRDPEMKVTPQGKSVCKFSIAVNRTYKGSDGEAKKDADFFNIVVWDKQGENCSKYLAKGRAVHIEGRLQNRTYEKDGQKHQFTEIVADNVQFLGQGQERKEDAPVREVIPEPETVQERAPSQQQFSEDVPF